MASSSCIKDQPPMTPKTRNRKRRYVSSPVRRTTSIFRGVTRHRLSGRFEAHLWDKNSDCINKKKKGKQIYLGAYDDEVAAARTYDLAALKHWGPETILNFEVNSYKIEMEEMKNMSNKEFIAFLRRKSSGFSRGASIYRGVARHHHNGRWEARLGRVKGNKYIYLGTYATQEEAAKAYDLAAIEYRGASAVTNFHISNYYKHINAPPTDEQQHDPSPSTDEQNDAMKLHDQTLIPEMQNLKFEQDHPWSLSMELGYTAPHVFPGDELDLFDDHGFEANIDSIFSKTISINNGCGFGI